MTHSQLEIGTVMLNQPMGLFRAEGKPRNTIAVCKIVCSGNARVKLHMT